jgi:hypothetical protein
MQPSPLGVLVPDFELHYIYAGRLVAKALLDDRASDINFTCSFLKHILGRSKYNLFKSLSFFTIYIY